MKKLFSIFLVSVCVFTGLFISSGNVNAQTAAVTSQPEVYIRDLSLTKVIYNKGDTVTGSFVLYNNKDQAVSDVYSEVTLAGGYQANTLATVFYDSIKMGPYYLIGKESKKIDFTYTLPAAVAGDNLGVQVSALLGTGFRMGWRDFMIKVEGTANFLNITKAFVSIGADKFGVEIGPVVYDTEKTFLEVTLTNPTKKIIEVNPKIKIYNQSVPSISKDLLMGDMKIAPGATANIKYELPKFDNKSGTYIGDVQFVDTTGVKRAVDFQIKYIIGGDTAVIKGLTTDRTVVNKGDNIKVTLNYSGPAYNVRDTTKKVVAIYDLNIKLFSEKGALTAEYNKPMDFSQGNETVLTLKALGVATNLRSEVTVKKGTNILAEYKSGLPKIIGPAITSSDYLKLFGFILLALIVLSGLVYVTVKTGKNNK